MVRWYYQSVFDELEEMRTYMESLSRQMYETSPMVLLPGPTARNQAAAGTAYRSPCRCGRYRQGSCCHGRHDSGDLQKGYHADPDRAPAPLKYPANAGTGIQEEKEGCFLRERRFGYMTRVITLPRPVSEEGSSASFKDGVLEVHLKISEKETKGKIPVS